MMTKRAVRRQRTYYFQVFFVIAGSREYQGSLRILKSGTVLARLCTKSENIDISRSITGQNAKELVL